MSYEILKNRNKKEHRNEVQNLNVVQFYLNYSRLKSDRHN